MKDLAAHFLPVSLPRHIFEVGKRDGLVEVTIALSLLHAGGGSSGASGTQKKLVQEAGGS
jgi:hypothetical protein